MATRAQAFDSRQHMKKNTYEVFRYKDAYPKEVQLHHHDFYEVYFFLSGNVNYIIESRTYLLSPGDVLLISPMELHQPMFGPEKSSYERIVLWINKSYLEQFNFYGQDMAQCFDTSRPDHVNLLRTEGTQRQMLAFLLEQLLRESQSGEFGSELYALSTMAQVLVFLNRLAIRPDQQPAVRDSADSVVYGVLTYINDHYSEDLSLDLLANKFFISKYHLSREFGRLVGTSVYRYIIQKRLVMAKRMMSEGVSSSVVYQHCGFGDYSNFYRAFKAEYQISPKEFMASLKNDAVYTEERGKFLRDLAEK